MKFSSFFFQTNSSQQKDPTVLTLLINFLLETGFVGSTGHILFAMMGMGGNQSCDVYEVHLQVYPPLNKHNWLEIQCSIVKFGT